MIVYSLSCAGGHAFEAWFQDSAAFDAQSAERAVECPVCGSAEVQKAIMAPRVARASSRGEEERPQLPAAPMTASTAHHEALARLLTELREHVEKNCDYVGDKFAEEARRIHYGEADARDIYGQTSLDEARELLEEGVKVAPLPGLPRRNS